MGNENGNRFKRIKIEEIKEDKEESKNKFTRNGNGNKTNGNGTNGNKFVRNGNGENGNGDKVNGNGKKKGRPTAYKPEYVEKMLEFFDREPSIDKKIPHYDKDGNIKWEDIKRMANKLPTLIDFAKSINFHPMVVYRWLEKHPEFSEAYNMAKEYQKWFLIQNGLDGGYNSLFAKFVLINISDMKDTSKEEKKDGANEVVVKHEGEIQHKVNGKIKDESDTNKLADVLKVLVNCGAIQSQVKEAIDTENEPVDEDETNS